MAYNAYARRMAYLRWRVDNNKALTTEQQAQLTAYEAEHPRRGEAPKATDPAQIEVPTGPTESQLKAREQLAQATKTDIKNTKAADLRMLVEDAGYELDEGATKGDMLEAAGLPREWAKS